MHPINVYAILAMLYRVTMEQLENLVSLGVPVLRSVQSYYLKGNWAVNM